MRFQIQHWFSVEPKTQIIHNIIIFQATKHLVYMTIYKVRKRIKVTAVKEPLLFLFGRGCAHKTTDFFVYNTFECAFHNYIWFTTAGLANTIPLRQNKLLISIKFK